MSVGKRCVLPATCALMALLATGCASPPKPPPPTELNGSLQAAADINPSVSGRPAPLLVRVYELKATAAFNKADFMSLYQRDQAELGPEMVAREEMMLNPGDNRPINRVAAPETRFIAVFAAYRDLDHAQWRSVVAVQPNQKQRLAIRAEALAISAVVAK